jgi:hypothetical protein
MFFFDSFSERRLAPLIEESWLLKALKPENLIEHDRDIGAFEDVGPEEDGASFRYTLFRKQPSGGASYTVRSGKSWFSVYKPADLATWTPQERVWYPAQSRFPFF